MKKLFVGFCLIVFTCVIGYAETSLDQYRAIVVSSKASQVVQHAAEDLQYYLQKVADRDIPIQHALPQEGLSLIVGPHVLPKYDQEIAELPLEGWVMRSIPEGILLAGNDQGPNGNFIFYHAVPLFLDKYCSVKWLWPGPTGEVISKAPELKFPDINEQGTPELKRRKIDFYMARNWAPDVREQFYRWQRNSLQGDQLKARFQHAWAGLFNIEDYKEHPEWFSLVKGQRLEPKKEAMNWQLCLSNKELRDEFYRRLTKNLKEGQIVSISPNDGGGFCECEACAAYGSIGDIYWDFAFDMATRMKKDHPRNGIGSFAYSFFRSPPKHIDKFPDNLWISMTTYSADHMSPQKKKAFFEFLDQWKSKNVHLIMREYWGLHYWQDFPILYPDEIADGIKIAKEAGLSGVYGEGSKNWSTQAPNYYVLTHIMWNPQANPDDILNEFYEAFGPAQKPVRAYFELLHHTVKSRWEKDNPTHGWADIAPILGNLFSDEVMQQAGDYLDEAEKLAGDNQGLKDKIGFLRMGYHYTKHLGKLFSTYNRLGDIGRFKEDPQPELTFSERKALLNQAWELGQERIRLFNKAYHTFAIDDGTYLHYIRPDSSWNHHGQVAHLLNKKEEDWVQLKNKEQEKK